MGCLKCGRDTDSGEVFCEECLDIMQYYPVKPGTAVVLPSRCPAPVRKVLKRRPPNLEEQIKTLRLRVLILSICLFVSLVIAGLLAWPAYQYFKDEPLLPGQNYSTITSPTRSVVESTSGN